MTAPVALALALAVLVPAAGPAPARFRVDPGFQVRPGAIPAPAPPPPARLADVDGQVWVHPDPDQLRRFVAARNAYLADLRAWLRAAEARAYGRRP